jgi:hypothetical protein
MGHTLHQWEVPKIYDLDEQVTVWQGKIKGNSSGFSKAPLKLILGDSRSFRKTLA